MANKNSVTLTFAGDAKSVQAASAAAARAVSGVATGAEAAGAAMSSGARDAADYTGRLSRVGNIATGMSMAIGDAGSSVQALADFQDRGRAKAMAHERALIDIEQAALDASQAQRDLAQSGLDLQQSQLDAEQAVLDADTALREYNEAVAEYGQGSEEARQAALDLKQANLDLSQAQEDGKQATEDGKQANVDAREALLNLAEAQHEAQPTGLAKAASEFSAYANVVTGAAGAMSLLAMAQSAVSAASMRAAAGAVAARVATAAGAVATGIATAAQWLWNVALTANPIGLVIVAIAALVAAIVWIATQTTWFQQIWEVVWGGIVAYFNWVKDQYVTAFNLIRSVGENVWGWLQGLPGRLKSAFSTVGSFITAPFRAAFNFVADAWNRTIGSMRWTVPDWVPGIGGNSISAPRLPKFHDGGVVPGLPGQEVLAILQAGERVTPAGESGGGSQIIRVIYGGDPAALEFIRRLVRFEASGNVQLAFGDG